MVDLDDAALDLGGIVTSLGGVLMSCGGVVLRLVCAVWGLVCAVLGLVCAVWGLTCAVVGLVWAVLGLVMWAVGGPVVYNGYLFRSAATSILKVRYFKYRGDSEKYWGNTRANNGRIPGKQAHTMPTLTSTADRAA